MNFTDAIADPFVWGTNWCTPSKDDMEHLMTAAKGQTDDKVTCAYVQESGVWGFKFTGKAGYETNSVFFPALGGGSSGNGRTCYWSGTPSGGNGWFMYLNYYYDLDSSWLTSPQDGVYLVHPVLKN